MTKIEQLQNQINEMQKPLDVLGDELKKLL